MPIKNSDQDYGAVAKSLHWIIAIIMIGMLCLGLYMVRLPLSLEQVKLIGWHKSIGVIVLALAFIRIGWRLFNITPSLSLPLLEKFAARSVHWAFYGFMFALPITGWLMSSAAGFPVSFFGLFTLPDLISPNDNLRQLLVEVHEWLAYGLIATICLHVAAALKHHFIDKDDILRRML